MVLGSTRLLAVALLTTGGLLTMSGSVTAADPAPVVDDGPVASNQDGGSGLGEGYLSEDGFVFYDELTSDITYPGDGSSARRYNPTGEDIVVDRVSTGRYVVTVSAGDTSFIPTVAAVGSSGQYCNLASWPFPGTFATVRCFDATGVSADSAFTMRWTSTDDDAALYVRANGTTCCDTNPWGGAPSAVKNGIGDYTVTVPGAPNFESGHVQVTAQGVNSNHCNVASMSGGQAQVLCFDQTGAAADNAFTMLRIGSRDDAYAWADDSTAAAYTPDTAFSHNPQGVDPTATRAGTGTYTVTFPDHLVDLGGSVAVTAFGTGSDRCTIVGWTDTDVQVGCHDVAGLPVDSQFNVLFTRFRLCGGLPANVEIGNGGVPTVGHDVIVGTAGDDDISALNGDDVVCAGAGNDMVIGSGGADTIFGQDGDDTIAGNADEDILDGGDGADVIFAGSGDDVVTGGPGDDLLGGSSGSDEISGDGGSDTVSGGSGDDGAISGGDGDDAVNGGAGNDAAVTGDLGNDTVSGNGGNDVIDGGEGNDAVRGGPGDDTALGGDGDDFVAGNDGIDICDGQDGTDTAAPNCETVLNVP
jgi:Ca2+-binding RTX toxin-like protein